MTVLGLDNLTDGTPLYARIARVLANRITSGQWPGGTRMPTNDQLMEEFAAGRATVREALQQLAQKGLITSRRGKGTFVLHHNTPPLQSRGWVESAPGFKAQVLSRELVAKLPPEVFEGLKNTGRYLRVRKVDYMDGEPSVYVEVYVPEKFAEELTEEALRQHHAYVILQHHLDDGGLRMRNVLTVDVADQEVAKMLNCNWGEPLVKWQRTMSDGATKEGLFYGSMSYIGSRYRMDISCSAEDFGRVAGVSTGIGLQVAKVN